jgi:pyroglutamyl-peptidase
VRLEGRLARVIVHWKLVAGDKVQYGYDHFTIVPVNGQWRIANLIFYETQGEDGR